MHGFTLYLFLKHFILEIFAFNSQRASKQSGSGSGKPGASRWELSVSTGYQESGRSWARASCRKSSPVSPLACLPLLRTCLSPKRALPREPTNSGDWPTQFTRDKAGPERRRDLWSRTEVEVASLLHSGSKFSPLYHVCQKLLETCLQSKFQIPVSSPGPDLEGSRVWCSRKREHELESQETWVLVLSPLWVPVPSVK